MKQIVALVKPFRAQAVIEALAELEIAACVVTEAKGYGRQKGYLDRYVGSEYSHAFLPKVEISAWVPDRLVRKAIDRIVQSARTGRMGDGKILVLPMAAEVIEIGGAELPHADTATRQAAAAEPARAASQPDETQQRSARRSTQ